MHKTMHRPAAKIERIDNSVFFERISWDDFRVFLACAQAASFRQAAQQLKLSNSTVVRRIERLETNFGTRFFDRLPEGVTLTASGEILFESARKMESAVFDVFRHGLQKDDAARGSVAVSATEGLGSFWIMPKLVEFHKEFPQLAVNLVCAMESADVLRLEADIAIQFERPTDPDLIVTKLARLHVFPFASKKYLDMFGKPENIQDMANHRLLLQAAPNVDPFVWCEKLGIEGLDSVAHMVTNSSNALFYAVEKDGGIGALPTFAAALGAPVVPVDIGIKHHLDVWMTYHPGVKKISRKAMVVDFLKSIFDHHTYPWFRDEFIHPNDLAGMVPSEATVNRGNGYFSVTPFKSRTD